MHAPTALACLAEARRAAIWPDWDFDAHPVALVVDEGTLLWGHPDPPAGFTPWRGTGTLPGPMHLGPAQTDLANSAVHLAGRVTATVRLENETDPASAARLIVHEAFHAFQQQIRSDWGVPFARTADYPEDDAANNALARAENAALAAYLKGSVAAAECAADVAALRATRYACVAADLPDYEDACEWCEGGGTLVEALAFPQVVRPELAAALLLHNRGGEGASIRRFYFTGAAIGVLCSELLPDWQQRWMATDATPRGLLGEPDRARAPAALHRWRAMDLLVEEAAATAGRRREDARLLAGMTPRVVIDVSAAPAYGFRHNPMRLRVLGGGRRIHGGAVRQEGSGWVLDVDEEHAPVLEDVRGGRLVLRAPVGITWRAGSGPLDLPFLQIRRAEVRPTGDGGCHIRVEA